jgi:hypothetical protein
MKQHFIKHTNSSEEDPSFVLHDNHESHLSTATINLVKEQGVTVLTFPLHYSHKLQPLAIAMYIIFHLRPSEMSLLVPD